jgi:hypothetical protein
VTALDQARLHELMHYDPATGVFTRRVTTGGRARAGSIAGSTRSDGYRAIKINGRLYKAHRLAWLYATGEWPNVGLDHRDGDPANNRFANLRPASQSQNTQNKKNQSNNSSRFKGVFLDRGLWRANITVGSKPKFLGYFDTPSQAWSSLPGNISALLRELKPVG